MDSKELKDQFTYHFFFHHGIFEDLYEFEDLIAETELFLKEKIEHYRDADKHGSDDPRFGKSTQFEFTFPGILWKSIFLNFYFFLESSLDQICNNIQNSKDYELTLKDISGNGIFRSSLYLKKVCGITKSFDTETWQSLNEFNKIRNILVHSNGIVVNSRPEIKTICNKHSIEMYKFDNSDSVILIKKEFCDLSLETISKFFRDIYSEMTESFGSH